MAPERPSAFDALQALLVCAPKVFPAVWTTSRFGKPPSSKDLSAHPLPKQIRITQRRPR